MCHQGVWGAFPPFLKIKNVGSMVNLAAQPPIFILIAAASPLLMSFRLHCMLQLKPMIPDKSFLHVVKK